MLWISNLTRFFLYSGKVILPNISLPSQNVYFRQGTNVEFGGSNGATEPPTVPPMEGYTLETLNPKTTDFSNPMYDAVQSGTLTEPSLENSKTGTSVSQSSPFSPFLTLSRVSL